MNEVKIDVRYEDKYSVIKDIIAMIVIGIISIIIGNFLFNINLKGGLI